MQQTLDKINRENMEHEKQDQEELMQKQEQDFKTPKIADIEIMQNIENEIKPAKLKTPKYHCSKCKDMGFIVKPGKPGDGYPAAEECSCYPYICLMQRLGSSQIPERYQGWELKNFKNKMDKNCYSVLVSWLDEFLDNKQQNSLYITGKVGTGKTSLSIALLKEVLSRRIDGLFIRVAEMLNLEKQRFSDSNLKSNIENIKQVSVLVLDDLGAERLTEWSLDVLWDIISFRYDSCLATIISSNLSLTQLKKYLSIRKDDFILGNITGQRIVRRLQETSQVINVYE